MTSSRHDPYGLGYTRVTMAITKGSNDANRSQPKRKNRPSSDCSLQFESMKMESLVIVDQHATVNSYLGLVLPARHALEVEWLRSLFIVTASPPVSYAHVACYVARQDHAATLSLLVA